MSDVSEQPEMPPKRSDLREAIRRVRLVNTEQADGLADLRDAERARLELLADNLADLFAEVPDDLDFFAFALSNGETPRLWIDMTCHVALGRDRRTYRLLKDTRLGRSVLHETADRDEMTAHVTNYVAERILDRQRAIEGDWLELKPHLLAPREPRAATEPMPATTLRQPDPTDAANEDVPKGKIRRVRRPEEASPKPSTGGTKWVAFFFGLLVGASALAGTLMAQGRL